MTTAEFEAYVVSCKHKKVDLNYCVVGICGEAGEIAEWHKKANLREPPDTSFTKAELKSELGDLLHYVVLAIIEEGWTTAEVMDDNKVKLDTRRALKVQRSIENGVVYGHFGKVR